MKKLAGIVALVAAFTLMFGIVSCNSNADEQKKSFVGTKKPNEAKEVGDIVFKDGSATPYTEDLELTDKQKAAAIALIFYKGTELNNGDDTTTSRTLGVGLKHSKDEFVWCTSDAAAFNKNITTIQCQVNGDPGEYTFTGDKNGSDNLEQISAFLVAIDGVEDDTATAEKYPAFYFPKNYKDVAGSNVRGTNYETGWYLPSIAELFQIYANGIGDDKVFDIEAASEVLGGNQFHEEINGSQFQNSLYWSSTQCDDSFDSGSLDFNFNAGVWNYEWKCYTYYTFDVCCIREF